MGEANQQPGKGKRFSKRAPSVFDEPWMHASRADGLSATNASGSQPSESIKPNQPMAPTVSAEDAAGMARLAQASRGKQAEQHARHSIHNELAVFDTVGDAHSQGVDGLGQAQVLTEDWPCDGCGYNLRGTRIGQPCPECQHVQHTRPGAMDQPGLGAWQQAKHASTSDAFRLLLLVGLVLSGGVFAIFGTLMTQMGGSMQPVGPAGLGWGWLALVVLGPTVEELMKVAPALLVVETKPHWFKNTTGIWLAALGAAFGFAAIENLIYLNVYVPNPSNFLIAWRWTVCVVLHVSATGITTIGMAKMWAHAKATRTPAESKTMFPHILAAIAWHGTYNALAIALQWTGMF